MRFSTLISVVASGVSYTGLPAIAPTNTTIATTFPTLNSVAASGASYTGLSAVIPTNTTVATIFPTLLSVAASGISYTGLPAFVPTNTTVAIPLPTTTAAVNISNMEWVSSVASIMGMPAASVVSRLSNPCIASATTASASENINDLFWGTRVDFASKLLASELISLLLNPCRFKVAPTSVLNSSLAVASPTITISGPTGFSSLTTATGTPQNVSSVSAFPTMSKRSYPAVPDLAGMSDFFVYPAPSWLIENPKVWNRPTIRHKVSSTPVPTGATVSALTTGNTTSSNVSSTPVHGTKPANITAFLGSVHQPLSTGVSLGTANPGPQNATSAPTLHAPRAWATRVPGWVTARSDYHNASTASPTITHSPRPTDGPSPATTIGLDSDQLAMPWGLPRHCTTTFQHLALMHMGPVTTYKTTATVNASVDCGGCTLVQKTRGMGHGPAVHYMPTTVTEELTTTTAVVCSTTPYM